MNPALIRLHEAPDTPHDARIVGLAEHLLLVAMRADDSLVGRPLVSSFSSSFWSTSSGSTAAGRSSSGRS
jgi:hypothetical protein